MKTVRVITLIPCILIAGCAATKTSPSMREVMNSWMGSHISQVIRQWGAHSQVVDDGAGGKIYIWITPQRASAPVAVYQPPVQRAQERQTQPIQIEFPRRTTTRGTMRWNPILQQYEWEEETTPSGGLRIPDISGAVRSGAKENTPTAGEVAQRVLREQMARRAAQPRPPQRREFFVRPDGTIHHWRISGY